MGLTFHSGFLNSINKSIARNDPIAIITLVKSDGRVEKAVLNTTGDLVRGNLNQNVIDGIRERICDLVSKRTSLFVGKMPGQEGEVSEVIIEILYPKQRMLVFGAGHVGQAVAAIGCLIGFAVTVYDDREEFLERGRFPDPDIELYHCDFSRLREALGKLKNSIIVIVTRGHQYDEECLRSVLDSSAAYIGMIGSRRRVMGIFRRLQGIGVEEYKLDRVHAPIGLNIGAVSPQEIAVAIVAEVIQELSKYKRTRNDRKG